MATFEPVLVGQIKSTGYTNFFNQLGANILNVKAGAYIAAGWNALPNSRDQGLIFENPVNTLALPFANKGTWTVNIDGGVVSYNATGLIFYNYLSATANVLNIGVDGGVGGYEAGIFASAATTINNKGNIAGQFGIDFNGFLDNETNGGLLGDNVRDSIPDSNITAATVLTVTNSLGAEIIGGNVQGKALNAEEIVGVNNFSYAKLTVTNNGQIIGGHDAYVDVNNDNQDDTGWGGNAISSNGGFAVTNTTTGVIEGDLWSGWVGTTLINQGVINGSVYRGISDRIVPDGFGGQIRFNSIDVTNILDLNHNGIFSVAGGDVLVSAAAVSTYNNSGTINGTYNASYDNNGTPNDVSDDSYSQVAFNLGRGKDQITNSGKVYGDVWTGGEDDTLTNSGLIQGQIDMSDGNDTVINTATATITGNYNPQSGATAGTTANLYHQGVNLGDGNNTLTNSGIIDGHVDAGAGKDTITNNAGGAIFDGVYVGRGGSVIVNSGTIYNHVGVDFDPNDLAATANDVDSLTNNLTGIIFDGAYLGAGNNIVVNAGQIYGGIGLKQGDDKVTNTGTVFGGVNLGDGRNNFTNSKVIFGDVNSGNAGAKIVVATVITQEMITNSGTINGGIYTGDGDRKIVNSGIVYDDIMTGNGSNGTGIDDVTNSKEVGHIELRGGDDIFTNSGIVRNGVNMGIGDDTVTNLAAGIIRNGINLDDGNNKFTNSGQVQGGVNGGSGIDTITNLATGYIIGSVFAGDGNNIYTNLGQQNGWFYSGSGTDKVDNQKTFFGSILTGLGGDIVTNGTAGHIYGRVIMSDYTLDYYGDLIGTTPNLDGANTLNNSGIIDGRVLGGDAVDTITNKGFINAEVRTFGGNDIVDNTLGKAIGEVWLGSGDDTFSGGVINETVHDEAGADKYLMGAGNDTIFVETDDGQNNIYDGGAGIDTLDFSQVATGNGITLTMASSLNVLTSSPNLVFGSELAGKAFNFEHVIGTSNADTVVGTALADIIEGRGGADTITGGGGNDKLYAGAIDGSVDTFVYNLVGDSGKTAATRDVIYQFEDANDVIQFNAATFDFNGVAAGMGVGTWLGFNVAFTGALGDINAVQVGGQTIVQIDTTGDKIADFSIALDGVHLNLSASDFLIV